MRLAAEEPRPRSEPLRSRPAAVDFFETSVRPVLVESCLKCHGPRSSRRGCGSTAARQSSRGATRPGGRAGQARREPARPGGGAHPRRTEDAAQGQAPRARRRGAPRGGSRSGHPGATPAGHGGAGRGQGRGRPLGVPPDPPRRSAAGQGPGLGPIAGRRLRAGPARARGARPFAAGRPADPDPPGHDRPPGHPADRRGDRGVRGRPVARRLRPRWSTACSPRPATASGGAGTGSTSPAMPTPRAMSSPRSGSIPFAYTYRDYVIRAFNARPALRPVRASSRSPPTSSTWEATPARWPRWAS